MKMPDGRLCSVAREMPDRDVQRRTQGDRGMIETKERTVDLNIDPERHNLTSARLVEDAIRNGEGMLSADGSLVVSTGQYTGRSPKDKFVVEEPSSKDKIWWGAVNQPISEESFAGIRDRMMKHLA